VVTFRLSEGEFNSLKLACATEQDSISAAARRAVLEWADTVSEQPKVEKRLNEMGDKLDTLLGLFYREQPLGVKVS
jgi:hypothetical protein